MKADVWLIAHDLIFHQAPSNMGEIAMLVIDESLWRTGLAGAERRPVTLTLDELGTGDLGALKRSERDRLRDLRRQLVDVLSTMPDGPVQASSLRACMLTADSAAEAYKLNSVQLGNHGFGGAVSPFLMGDASELCLPLRMLRVDHARWGQIPDDLRQLATSAAHQRTRGCFLALYEIAQAGYATQVAARTRRHSQTVMEWLHLYNEHGPGRWPISVLVAAPLCPEVAAALGHRSGPPSRLRPARP